MLQAVRSARSARSARGARSACEKIVFPSFFQQFAPPSPKVIPLSGVQRFSSPAIIFCGFRPMKLFTGGPPLWSLAACREDVGKQNLSRRM